MRQDVEQAARRWIVIAVTVGAMGGGACGRLGYDPLGDGGVDGTVAGEWGAVTAGQTHSCAIRRGTLWCWGDNSQGQLGLEGGSRTLPEIVGDATDWSVIVAAIRDNPGSSGGLHTCGVRGDGSAWCWGDGDGVGALGTGTNHEPVPARVGDDAGWDQVVTTSHSCGVRRDGTLWCWGAGMNGQLGTSGQGAQYHEPAPVQISAGDAAAEWTRVVVGTSHTCALRGEALWCWGSGGNGQLGIGTQDQQLVPAEVDPGTRWRSVAAGGSHTCGIRADGSLWCWGDGSSAQLGTGMQGGNYKELVPAPVGEEDDWIGLAAGFQFTCAIRADASLWCWGQGGSGQLGTGTTSSHAVPVPVGDATDWVQVDCGRQHACGVRADGSLWCWGQGSDGQLGTGDTGQRTEPTRIAL